MAAFIGMAVRLTLRHPPNAELNGIVQEVIAGQTLTLRDVYFPATGQRWDTWTVQGSAIADLQVIQPSSKPPQPPHTFPPNMSTPPHHVTPNPSATAAISSEVAKPFVDPAILSFGKTNGAPKQSTNGAPSTPIKSTLARAAESLPSNSSPFVGIARSTQQPQVIPIRPAQINTMGTNSRPQELDAQATALHVPPDDTTGKQKSRRGQKKKGASNEQDPPPVMNVEVSRNGNDMSGAVKRGKGWRQGPFLQPSATASPEPAVSKRAGRKARVNAQEAVRSGWVTEDATDIQGLDDFDFIASNKLFDKKQVFDELRQGDTTADEDRLVSHNRLARPGTHGGKNLHPTENVLSPKLGPKYHSNEVDSASDADTELGLTNGRSSSRHSHSRIDVVRKQASRQNSILHDSKAHGGSASVGSDWAPPRSATSIASKGRQSMAGDDRQPSPLSAVTGFRQSSVSRKVGKEPRFLLKETLTTCPVLHPAALATLESETISRFGLNQDAITENASRSIAEVALSMFQSVEGSRRGSRSQVRSDNVPTIDRGVTPVVVILAGSHNGAARAVGAARHLASRRVKVIVAEFQHDASSNDNIQMRSQLSMIRRMQRGGSEIKRGAWQKASQYIKTLAGPPSLIIDALLDGRTYASLSQSTEPLEGPATQEAREMIDWANRSRAPVLSVECPSGVSSIDGLSTVVEGEPLAIRPDHILCLGMPVSGLYEAMKQGERWHVSIADTSINIALRQDEAVAFGTRFVAELEWDVL